MQTVPNVMRALALGLFLGGAGAALAADDRGSAAQSAGGPYEVFGLHSDDMLVIRAAPDVLSAPIGWIEYDARDVMVLEVSGDVVWGRVARAGTEGWVMLRHLRSPAP